MSDTLADFCKFVDLIEGRAMACDGPATPFLEQLEASSDAEKDRFTKILAAIYKMPSMDEITKERDHFYSQFRIAWAALTPVSENEKRGMERVLAILRSKQSEAVDEGNGFGPTWSARNKAFKECAEMLRLALEAEAPPSPIEPVGYVTLGDPRTRFE